MTTTAAMKLLFWVCAACSASLPVTLAMQEVPAIDTSSVEGVLAWVAVVATIGIAGMFVLVWRFVTGLVQQLMAKMDRLTDAVEEVLRRG